MSADDDVLLEESLAQKALSREVLGRLFALTRPYRTLFFLNLLGTTLAVSSQLLGPYLIQCGIDRYLSHITTQQQAMRGILIISGIYLANLALGWALTVAQVRTALAVGWGIMNDLRLEVFQHIQRLSLSYFDKTHQGRIINRADADIDAMEQVLTWGANQFLASTLTLIGVFFILAHYDWRLCLTVSVVLPPLAIATYLFQKYIMEAHRQVRRQSSRLTASLAENISGVRVVQAMGRENENLDKFQELHEVYTDLAYNVARIFHTYMPSLGLISGIGIAIVLGYGGTLVLRHEVTVGELAAFIIYVGMFFGPVQTMGDLFNNALSAGACAERIFHLLDTKPQVVDQPGAQPLPLIQGQVRFENVSFRYETTSEDRWVLDDVDFRVEAGQTIALVGHTGSGKTSIISLLARFYEPQRGRVLVDGHDVAQSTIESLHRQLGIVTQENFLFTGTILDNLRFGRPEATDEEVHAAAKAMGTDEMIRQMKDGYATQVAERGGNFSAGTRQLLCITRALVAQPRILILDEATSAVDSKSEGLIQAALDILLQGRTTFVIAHRLSTVRKASLILVLQHGRIVERGTHESLSGARTNRSPRQVASMRDCTRNFPGKSDLFFQKINPHNCPRHLGLPIQGHLPKQRDKPRYFDCNMTETPQFLQMSGNPKIRLRTDVSSAPLIMMVVAMFTDAFLYEMVVPLTPFSRAGVIDDARIEILYGGYAFSVLFLTPLWSWLAERIGYKRSLIFGAIAQIATALLFALAQNFTILLMARIAEGASSAATWTVGLALIVEHYPDKRVQKMGLVMSGSTIGSIFGPLVGGLLYDWGGYFAPFYGASVLLLTDLALRLTLLRHIARPTMGRQVLVVLLRNRAVLVAAIVVALVAWNWAGVIEPWLPSHLENNLGATPSAVGFIFTVSCVAYALATSPVDRLAERRGLGKTIGLGVVLMAVGMPLLTLHLSLLWICVILSLISIGFAFALNPTLAALADAVDRCALGAYAAVYALFNIAYSVGTIGGAMTTGALEHYLSTRGSFGVSSAFLLASAPLIIWGLREKATASSPS